MEASIWTETLARFREETWGTHPVPAGVTISAITASLALALLAKVLDIAGRRKDFNGDRERLVLSLDAARSESTRLTQLADEDVRAFNRYLECVRRGHEEAGWDQAITAAVRQAIEVPMNAARSAVRGLDLCAEAVGMVQGLTAADLGIAAALLSGAVRAMLLSVDFNLREMRSDKQFSDAITAERRELELEALRRDAGITSAVSALLE
jgi:formiminotetrahydrofolate cyclodeaminase